VADITVVDLPLVSILIPNYNYAQYVEQAVASALGQTYPNVEVVVSDNCSTDGAWELLNERFGQEPRVRLSRNERNLGIGPNFDRVLELARGEFVMWLSSDDVLYPTHVERLMTRFLANPTLDVVYGNAYFARADGLVFRVRNMAGQFPVSYTDARDELVENFTTTCPVCMPCMLVRREALRGYAFASTSGSTVIASDWDIVIRLALAGRRFAYVAEPSVAVRLHDDQHSGAAYHGPGTNILDFAAFVERYMDHPEFVRRMRGREIGVAQLFATLLRDNADRNGGTTRLDEEQQARVRDLQERLLSRAVVYEPARVHESTITVVMETSAPPALVTRSLDTLVAQTWPAWELVVVDHGFVPLEGLLRAHPVWERTSHIRFESTQPAGAARNLGLRMARGEYVTFLEPGNRFAPEHLASAVETIARERTQAVLATSRLVFEQADGDGIVWHDLGVIAPFGGGEEDLAALEIAHSVPLDALVVYRGLFDRVGRFNPGAPLFDDWDFALRLTRGTRVAPTRAATLSVSARIGLVAQRVGDRRAALLASMDAIHAAYPVDAAREEERRRHRTAIAQLLGELTERTATTRGLAEFACALAGRGLAVAAG